MTLLPTDFAAKNPMHELGITQEILAVVTERSGGARVRRVVLEIGKLAAILPDALRFCFEVCSAGTVAEGAELQIDELPGRARCRQCGAEVQLDRPFGRCTCGSTDFDWLSGEELRIKEMEVV
jgi:hydrogenase nickel incorporation protein HypA/HybF